MEKIKTGTTIIAIPYCFYNKNRDLVGFTEAFKWIKEKKSNPKIKKIKT